MTDLPIPDVAPAVLLSVLVGALWTCVYVLIRGQLRWHVVLVLAAAVVGAWAGQAVGARVGDPFRMGDYSLTWASAFAWVGILVVSIAAGLGARTPRTPVSPAATAAAGSPPGRETEDA
jgi:hypothetical protein